jgi:hypothetical protein
MITDHKKLREKLMEMFSYNPDNGLFTRIANSPSNNTKIGKVVTCTDEKGYVVFMVSMTPLKAHRAAWLYMYGYLPLKQIDHINGIHGDNRIANLREATGSENRKNCPAPKSNTSGFKGVSWNSRDKKWQAQGRLNGKRKALGYFDTPQEASEAYINFAKQFHGEFLNIGVKNAQF